MTFATVEERASRRVVRGQALRLLQGLTLADARRLLKRAQRKKLYAELVDAGLPEVASALAAFELAVLRASALLASEEN